MSTALRRVRDITWGTRDGWSVVRERGIKRFMFRAAIGWAVWLAVFVEAFNAWFHKGAFAQPVSVKLVVGRLLFDFGIQFCAGLWIARLMWYQFDRTWVNDEISRSEAARTTIS